MTPFSFAPFSFFLPEGPDRAPLARPSPAAPAGAEDQEHQGRHPQDGDRREHPFGRHDALARRPRRAGAYTSFLSRAGRRGRTRYRYAVGTLVSVPARAEHAAAFITRRTTH